MSGDGMAISVDVEKKSKCCDMFNQSASSLSSFLLLALLANTGLSVLWMYTWMDVELSQYISSNEKSGMLIFVGFVTGVSVCAGLYGVYSLDRGWLMLTVIFESSLVTTCGIYVGTLLRIRSLGASEADGQELTKYSALVMAASITAGWFAFRTQEKIQEDHHETKRVPGGFDLPDMDIAKFKLMISITSTLCVLMGAELMIVGSLIEQPNGMARNMFRIHLMSWGGLFILTGLLFLFFHLRGNGSNRVLLTFSTTLGFLLMTVLTGVAGWMHFFREWYKESCAAWNNSMELLGFEEKKIESCTMELLLGDAQVVVSYIAWVTVTIHIWGCWRLAEKIQTEEIDDDKKPSTLLKVINTQKIDNLRLFVNLVSVGLVAAGTAQFITWLAFQGADCDSQTTEDEYLLTYEAPMNCTSFIDESDEDAVFAFSRLEMFLNYNYIPFILCIITGGSAFYGVYDEDRGWLILSFLFFVAIFGSTYPMMMFEQFEILDGNWLYDGLPEGWPRNLEQVSAHGKVLISFFSLLGVVFTFLLSEAVQDKKELGLEKTSRLCVMELDEIVIKPEDESKITFSDSEKEMVISEQLTNTLDENYERIAGSSRVGF